jgi:peptidyl-prolyl cis-trans isomerase C
VHVNAHHTNAAEDSAPGARAADDSAHAAVTVDGRPIGADAIGREMQYHPAAARDEAWQAAARALVIRELLLQEAVRQGIDAQPDPGEAGDEALIRRLVEREVRIDEPDEASCRRFHEKNRDALRAPQVHVVSHILLVAPEEPLAREDASRRARALIGELAGDVGRFGELARQHSACPSREAGGRLGALRPGQAVPEFERALARLAPGQIAPGPIETRYGYHVVYLESRTGGEPYNFDAARALVADYLRESLHRRALLAYVQTLAGSARIRGIDLLAPDAPLVR